MKNKGKYTEGPIGEVKVVSDFLPPPEKLAFKEEQDEGASNRSNQSDASDASDKSDGSERGKYRMKRPTKNKGKRTDDPDDELVPIESTAFWKTMQQNRVGNLLAGARLKAGMTQAQLAQALGIRQNMISDYERGRRVYSAAMAKRLSQVLHVKEQHLTYGDEPED